MVRMPFILVSPSIEERGVEFDDLSSSLSLRYELAILAAGGIPIIAPATTTTTITTANSILPHNAFIKLSASSSLYFLLQRTQGYESGGGGAGAEFRERRAKKRTRRLLATITLFETSPRHAFFDF